MRLTWEAGSRSRRSTPAEARCTSGRSRRRERRNMKPPAERQMRSEDFRWRVFFFPLRLCAKIFVRDLRALLENRFGPLLCPPRQEEEIRSLSILLTALGYFCFESLGKKPSCTSSRSTELS